jgi:hypothetical protein
MKGFIPDRIEAFRLVKGGPDFNRAGNNMFVLDGLFIVVYPPLESLHTELSAPLTDEPPSIHGT